MISSLPQGESPHNHRSRTHFHRQYPFPCESPENSFRLYTVVDNSTHFNHSPALLSLNPNDSVITRNGLRFGFAGTMHSDAWDSTTQLMPKPSRLSDQRESSTSSLGGTLDSTSPLSGNVNTCNPQVAISDSVFSGITELRSHEPTRPQMTYPLAVSSPHKKPRSDRSLLPAPELAPGRTRSPSRLASAASPTAGDSPATPSSTDNDHLGRRRTDFCNVPKLDRTMTDVYGDELYSPNFSITSTSPSQRQAASSPSNDVFHQRIHAANSQHLSAAKSPSSTVSRTRSSPFRTGSPFALSSNTSANVVHLNSSQRIRGQNQIRKESTLLPQQGAVLEPETPKTISPKDAILEFNDTDTESSFPLFPADVTHLDNDVIIAKSEGNEVGVQDTDGTNAVGFLQSQVFANMPVTQQFACASEHGLDHRTPPRLSSSASTSTTSGNSTPIIVTKPPVTGADGGTYTCTYHGCTQRFETPLQLQKHKREGHRQAQTVAGPRETGACMNMLNTQAGPHRCDRINPSTGKPCCTIFSRPYDLTRHEDTIHNARKQKVRCDLCTEEKTFSRADALTRHYRVCHPEVELPGKHKRRGGI
ncbi:hypothetical protein CDD83_4694 [Cordyceps sp. RAO-2017]|nr:hypothetical protein CDD83_4694 [Cordyceps sp. RAO-2017]